MAIGNVCRRGAAEATESAVEAADLLATLRDCLLVVDVFSDFSHEQGDALLEAFRGRANALAHVLQEARERKLPVIFANDTSGMWDGDARGLVERALAGPGGDLIRPLIPDEGEAFLVKPRYSAFDLTPLQLVLEQLAIERLLLAGSATEMCVAQTAIDARERGFKVTVLAEACVSLDETNEQTALRYLQDVTGTEVVRAFEQVTPRARPPMPP
jgi:nicotinamidase-related amidase